MSEMSPLPQRTPDAANAAAFESTPAIGQSAQPPESQPQQPHPDPDLRTALRAVRARWRSGNLGARPRTPTIVTDSSEIGSLLQLLRAGSPDELEPEPSARLWQPNPLLRTPGSKQDLADNAPQTPPNITTPAPDNSRRPDPDSSRYSRNGVQRHGTTSGSLLGLFSLRRPTQNKPGRHKR